MKINAHNYNIICLPKSEEAPRGASSQSCCGGRICTDNLKVMSLASYYYSTPLYCFLANVLIL